MHSLKVLIILHVLHNRVFQLPFMVQLSPSGSPSQPDHTAVCCVETHSNLHLTISIWGAITLGAWSYLSHKDSRTSAQTVAACSISRLPSMHIRLTPSSLPHHARAETCITSQPHIVIGHFCEALTLMMVLPIQVLVLYIYMSETMSSLWLLKLYGH